MLFSQKQKLTGIGLLLNNAGKPSPGWCSILEAGINGIYSKVSSIYVDKFAMLLLQIYELLFQSTESICEWACYFGTSLSAIIAWRLFRMEKLTWINKMFLCYFCIDVIFSSIETYFLFKLYKERYVILCIQDVPLIKFNLTK